MQSSDQGDRGGTEHEGEAAIQGGERQLQPLAVTQKQETSARVGVVGTKAAGEGALGPGIVPPGDLCMGEAGERCEQSKQRP